MNDRINFVLKMTYNFVFYDKQRCREEERC